jgi:hypothetical protein
MINFCKVCRKPFPERNKDPFIEADNIKRIIDEHSKCMSKAEVNDLKRDLSTVMFLLDRNRIPFR